MIQAVAGAPARQKIDEMCRRVRILDALDKATTASLALEDADHAHGLELVNELQFGGSRNPSETSSRKVQE